MVTQATLAAASELRRQKWELGASVGALAMARVRIVGGGDPSFGSGWTGEVFWR